MPKYDAIAERNRLIRQVDDASESILRDLATLAVVLSLELVETDRQLDLEKYMQIHMLVGRILQLADGEYGEGRLLEEGGGSTDTSTKYLLETLRLQAH